MAERFTRLYQIGNDLYADDSPIVISAGALLKDTVTGSIIVQLKFQNVSSKSIMAAKIKLIAYDVTGKALQDAVEYQYLDLNTPSEAYWGGDKAVILPGQITRSFAIKSVEIVFSDGETWKTDNVAEFASIPVTPLLETELSDKTLADQYRLETHKNAKYIPKEYGRLWRCTCGYINQGAVCTMCRLEKTQAFNALNVYGLSARAAARLEAEAKQAAKHQAEQKKQQKTTAIALTVGAVLIVAVAFFALWVMPNVIEPASRYNDAMTLYEAGEYYEAERLFAKLDGYKDSDELMQSIPYCIAEDLLESGDYEAAIAAFYNLGDYRDSADRALEIAYQYAQKLQTDGEYISARKWFEAAMPYADSAECVDNLHDLIYAQGAEFFAQGNYSEALVCLKEIPDTFQTGNTPVSVLIEQAEIAKEYLSVIDTLEQAGETVNSSETLNAVIQAIQRYRELYEDGNQITGKDLSDQKKYMVELYYLYAGYNGTYFGEYGFSGNVSVELSFSQNRSETGYFFLKISGTKNYLYTEYMTNGNLNSEHYRLLDESNIIYTGDSTEFVYSRGNN